MENENKNNASSQEEKDYGPRPPFWWGGPWKEPGDTRKWRHHPRPPWAWWPYHGIFCGLTLILFGVLFLLNQTGTISGDTWWQALLIGLGAISIIDGLVRAFHPYHRWRIFGKFFIGVVLILIGTFFMLGISEWWPVILIAAGALFLLRPMWRRRVSP